MKRLWHRGSLRDGDLTLSPQDRGLTLGDGLFETLLVHNGVALWRGEHLARLRAASGELGIACPDDEIEDSIKALCAGLHGHHVLRLTLTRGSAGRGLAADTEDSTYFATTLPFDRSLLFQPVDLAMASVFRNESSPSSRLKTLSYMDQIAAAREAGAEGFDDALMLNSKGHLASATIGNVFLTMGQRIVTPSLDQGILPGIMRAAVIGFAPQAGFAVEERAIEAHEVERADGVFVSNSLRFLRPSKRHGGMLPTALVELLCAAAKAQSGTDPRHD